MIMKSIRQVGKSVPHYLPVLTWGKTYSRAILTDDMMAALIVTIMLIPQSLAYALLAGLPAQMGLYASMIPIILYAVFGTSATLAVGPVAVVSLMTAVAIGKVADPGSAEFVTAALTLAFLSGAFLILLGIFRLGFLANFLSHPVIAGFITASGILIATSQLKHILGISADGHNLPDLLASLADNIQNTNVYTAALGSAAVLLLFWIRTGLKPLLKRFSVRPALADIAAKTGPVIVVIATILLAWTFDLGAKGVALVGQIPQGLPPLTLPSFSTTLWRDLTASAIIISVIGFVESISVAQTLAAKRRQRIDPDQELIGLGAANMGAAFTGGFPVTGGFSRSVVNFDAGARTPAAGAYTAMGLALASLFLTPLIAFLPKAALAATIIVAVLSLVDFSILKKTWQYSKADFAAVSATLLVTLVSGVELGVIVGVLVSLLIHLYNSSRPHIAIVGQVPGTEHYRNILRHNVITQDTVLSMRVDESLYFANARFLEDAIAREVAEKPSLQHLVLLCAAVNHIDMSALESLEEINDRLKDMNVKLHLSEVKGPVMDRLQDTEFLKELSGRVFLNHHLAIQELSAESKAAQSVA